MTIEFSGKRNYADVFVVNEFSETEIICSKLAGIDQFFSFGKFHIEIAGDCSKICLNSSEGYEITKKSRECSFEMNIAKAGEIRLPDIFYRRNKFFKIAVVCPCIIRPEINKGLICV